MKKINIFICHIMLALLFTISFASEASSKIKLSGQFSVYGGDAHYSLPINMPRGRNSLTPQLGIHYQSVNYTDVLGEGGSLDGLSSIYRCGKNLQKDGYWGGITFSDDDRYCLDGKRLIAVNGKDGDNLVEYRLEENGYSKIISYSSDDVSGPEYFKVWTTSGEVYEYGMSGTSQEAVDGAGIYKWLLNEQIDNSGKNNISYHYIDNGKGKLEISRITYTGGEAQFSYVTRPDVRKTYLFGKTIIQNSLLSSISIYDSSSSEIGHYSLSYVTSEASGASLLSTIQYCSTDNCSEPIQLNWQSGKPKKLSQKTALNLYQADFIDIDRDGHMDAYGVYERPYSSTCSTGGSTTKGKVKTPQGKIISKVAGKYLLTGTVNSPNIKTNTYKYIYGSKSNYTYKCYYSKGGERQIEETRYIKRSLSNNPVLNDVYQPDGDGVWKLQTDKTKISGDFNGDGKDTLMTKKVSSSENRVIPDVGDIDGDGMDDYYVHSSSSRTYKFYLSTKSYKAYSFTAPSSIVRVLIKNINNDSYADMVMIDSSRRVHGYYFNGKSFVSAFKTDKISNNDYNVNNISIIDYDSDGYPELYSNNKFYKNKLGSFVLSSVLATVKSVVDDVDYNGDGINDLVIADSAGKRSILIHQDEYVDKINQIDEFDISYGINYKPASDPEVLEQVRFYNFPFTNVTPSKFIVSSATKSAKGYSTINTDYHYIGARAHINGGGFLGYGAIEETQTADVTTKTVTVFYRSIVADDHFELGDIKLGLSAVSVYSDDGTINGVLNETLYLYGLPTSKQVYRNNYLISNESYSYKLNYFEGYDAYYYQYYPQKTIKNNYELGSSSVKSKVITTRELDSNGKLISEQQTISSSSSSAGSFTTSVANNYLSDSMGDVDDSSSDPEQFWKYGALTRTISSITDNSTGLVSASQQSYTYDDHGQVASKTKYGSDEQGNLDASNYVTKSYGRDEWGNIIHRTMSGTGFTTRSNSNSYDTNGLNLISSTNAKGHSTHFSYDAQGQLIQQVEPLKSRTTSINYDSFGRVASKTFPGSGNNQSYQYALGIDCPNALESTSWCVIVNESSGEQHVTHYDFADREIRTLHTAFDGKWVAVDTTWDTDGRKLSVSRPYFVASATASAQVEFTYDVLNRLLTKSEPASSGTSAVFSYSYDGYTTQYTDARGFKHSESANVLGHILSKNEPLGATQIYSYYPDGRLKQSTDSSGNTTAIQYDSLGNRTYLDDPDLGKWNYTYNALGELTSQTDANGIKTKYQYDVLGRKISETTPENESTWSYDENNADGMLTSMEGNGSQTEYDYDSQGLLDEVAVTVDGETFKTDYAYDSYERLKREIRPSTDASASGSDEVAKRLIVEYVYNMHGYVSAVRSPKSYADKAFTSAEFRNEIRQLLDSAVSQAEAYLEKAEYYANQQTFYTNKAAEYSSQTVSVSNLDNNSLTVLGDGHRYKSWCYNDGSCYIQKSTWTMVDGQVVIPFTVGVSKLYRLTVSNVGSSEGGITSYTTSVRDITTAELFSLEEKKEGGIASTQEYYLDDYDGDGKKDLVSTVDAYSAQNDSETADALLITAADLQDAVDVASQNYRVYTDLANDLISLSEKIAKISGVYCEKANELGGDLIDESLRGDCENTEETSQAEHLDLILTQSELEESLGNQAYLYYWQRRDTDAYDHTLSETLGNGLVNTYQYDSNTGRPNYFVTDRANVLYSSDGVSAAQQEIRYIQYHYDNHNNVTERYDQQLGITDRWSYDALDRVTQNTIILADKTQHGVDNPDLSTSFSYAYDKLGNITNKSDIGDYTYAGSQAGPHAVTQAGNTHFEYDEVGNMVRGYQTNSGDSDERTITWSEFNKPTKLVKDGNTVTFDYDANHNRFAKSTSNGIKTLYLGQSYERQTDSSSGKITHINYIYADGKLIALNSQAYDSDDELQDKQVRYLHYDALNSVDMVTDGYGLIVERRSYDTWGKQRKIVWQDDGELSVVQELLTTRGYTGHEEISEIGLIHMNGRVYDQQLARFTSADPLVQDPYFTGSYNRYSYVWNNPLKYIDPTGFAHIEGAGIEGQHVQDSRGDWRVDTDPTKDTDRNGYEDGSEREQAYHSTVKEQHISYLQERTIPIQTPHGDVLFETQQEDLLRDLFGSESISEAQNRLLNEIGNQMIMGAEAYATISLFATPVPAAATEALVVSASRLGYLSLKSLMRSPKIAEIGVPKVGRGQQVGSMIKTDGSTTASAIKAKAESVGFNATQTANGPLKMVDENGVARVTIKAGSPRTPGSEGPHVELKTSSGQRVNPAGNPVTRSHPENHTTIDFDL